MHIEKPEEKTGEDGLLVSAEDERRAQSLANNLSVIPEQKEKIIAEILSLNPFYEDVYKYAIINNLDIDYEFGKIGQYFDIDICDSVNMLIANKLDKLDVNSKKELRTVKHIFWIYLAIMK